MVTKKPQETNESGVDTKTKNEDGVFSEKVPLHSCRELSTELRKCRFVKRRKKFDKPF